MLRSIRRRSSSRTISKKCSANNPYKSRGISDTTKYSVSPKRVKYGQMSNFRHSLSQPEGVNSDRFMPTYDKPIVCCSHQLIGRVRGYSMDEVAPMIRCTNKGRLGRDGYCVT